MILITGGTGLLGSHLVYKLISMGENVRVLVRDYKSKEKLFSLLEKIYGNVSDYYTKIDFVIGDITNFFSLQEAFKDVKYVYHCAAKVSLGKSLAKEMLETNIRGTANVVNACLGNKIEKLVHVSSIAAIGTSEDGKILDEGSGWPTGKALDYGYSKTESEFEVWRGISEGLNAVIVNPSVILGEGDLKTGNGLLFHRVYKGMKYYTKGVTGFVDVKDVVQVMISLMKGDFSANRYIVNAANISYKDFFGQIAESVQVKAPLKYAGQFITEIAWRLEKLRAFFMFKEPVLTKKVARSAHTVTKYSSGKVIEALNYTFAPLKITILRVAKYYMKEFNV